MGLERLLRWDLGQVDKYAPIEGTGSKKGIDDPNLARSWQWKEGHIPRHLISIHAQ